MGQIVSPATQAIWQSNLSATPSFSAPGTTITANATIHTKGATYTTLIASTTYDSYGFWLGCQETAVSGSNTSMLLDIAIGAASSEQVIVPNWMCGFRAVNTLGNTFDSVSFFPLFIPAGTRISARSQAIISADTVNVLIFLNGGTAGLQRPVFVGCDAYGINTADSGATAHTPGAGGTESTDAAVGSTLSRAYRGVMLNVGGNTTAYGQVAYHFELTDGTNTLCEWYSQTNTSEVFSVPIPLAPYNVALASGAQLQIQAEGGANSLDVAFYCFY